MGGIFRYFKARLSASGIQIFSCLRSDLGGPSPPAGGKNSVLHRFCSIVKSPRVHAGPGPALQGNDPPLPCWKSISSDGGPPSRAAHLCAASNKKTRLRNRGNILISRRLFYTFNNNCSIYIPIQKFQNSRLTVHQDENTITWVSAFLPMCIFMLLDGKKGGTGQNSLKAQWGAIRAEFHGRIEKCGIWNAENGKWGDVAS